MGPGGFGAIDLVPHPRCPLARPSHADTPLIAPRPSHLQPGSGGLLTVRQRAPGRADRRQRTTRRPGSVRGPRSAGSRAPVRRSDRRTETGARATLVRPGHPSRLPISDRVSRSGRLVRAGIRPPARECRGLPRRAAQARPHRRKRAEKSPPARAVSIAVQEPPARVGHAGRGTGSDREPEASRQAEASIREELHRPRSPGHSSPSRWGFPAHRDGPPRR